jgi:hypothetical protein
MATRAPAPFSGTLRKITTGLGLMAVGVALVLASAGPASADHRVTICHATGSESNPYVVNTPAKAGVVNAHIDHQHDEDIIPPFEYQGQTYEQNWDAEGQAIHEAGCTIVTSTPTTTAPTTTTPAEGTKTTTPTTDAEKTTTTPAAGTTAARTTAAGTTAAGTTAAKTTAAQRTAAATTTRTAGPIPGAVDAGQNEASSWQLPAGAALIALGGLWTLATIARRTSARR